jgi:hypothetical protein
MHAQTTAARELAEYFDTGSYGHAGSVALVLESYGQGYAWLSPSTEPAGDDDALYWPTAKGIDQVNRWAAE